MSKNKRKPARFKFKTHKIQAYALDENSLNDYILGEPYGKPKIIDLENQDNQKIICCYKEENSGGMLQISFNTMQSIDNNKYGVLYVPKSITEKTPAICFEYLSHVVLPPVWNREFIKIDFIDLIAIKCVINCAIRNSYKFEEFQLDDREGHMVVMTKEPITPQEAKGGKQYEILALKAEVFNEDICIVDREGKEYIL